MLEDKYINRREESIAYIQELSNNIRSFKELNSNVFGLSIRNTYFLIAYSNLLLDQVNEAKKYFYKGAKMTCETFKIFKEGRYPNLKKKGALPFNSLFVKSFLDAILCDNDTLLTEFAQTIEGNEIPSSTLRFNYEITNSLKYLILKDFKKSKDHLVQAHQSQYFNLPYKGFSHIIKGILESDVNLVNEGITYRLRHHIKENTGTVYYKISIETTALIKLALMFNLDPDTTSPFIHMGLINNNENISYESIDEILNSLKEANRRNDGFLNRVFGFLK